jgi:ankyrin repeat protein
MRLTHLALATALSLTFGTHSHAQTTCGQLCTSEFWDTATPTKISEVIAAEGVNARSDFGWTPLLFIAAEGTPENILALLDAGADVNARNELGVTPLHRAVRLGTPENVMILLEAGADVNARKEGSVTPLSFAAWYGSPENVMALLEAGADATITDVLGLTPWDIAKGNGKLEGTDAYWALNDARFE